MPGLLIQVYFNGTKWITAAVPDAKRQPGCKLGHHACVHHLKAAAGSTMKMTPARRKRVAEEHRRGLVNGGGVRCKHHKVAWKKLGC